MGNNSCYKSDLGVKVTMIVLHNTVPHMGLSDGCDLTESREKNSNDGNDNKRSRC